MKPKTLLPILLLSFVGCNLLAQNTYVPDDYFEMALIALGYDSGELNDSVPTMNIKSVVNLDVSERNISDLTGIEDFESLGYLRCTNNKISVIDVSKNLNLKTLDCIYNQITDIDVSKNLDLETLLLEDNQLTTLDVSHNSKLKELWCTLNNLTSLNVDSNPDLRILYCHRNKIEELDVSKNVKLTELWCHVNNLRKLNIKNGNNYYMDVHAGYNPDLFCIEVDNPILSAGYSSWRKDEWCCYSTNCPSPSTDTITACDSFVWIDGNIYTSSNDTATYTLTSVEGCDSVVSLDLTILKSTSGIDVQTACDSFTWIDGKTYSENNNTASYTLTNNAGCDSIVTLNLNILKSTGVDIQTACDSFTWIDGKTYTENNNTATYILTNNAGCDSIITLNLEILKPTYGVDIQTSCDFYTWIDGKTYSESNNTATYTLTNDAGCDSIVTLNLNIINIDKSLANNDSTIIAIQGNATYQWLDCSNDFSIIEGANSQFYTITKSGSYAVEISRLGCIDTSACINLNLVGINQINFKKVKVYPNPSDGNLNINFGGLLNPVIRVLTSDGKLVYEQTEIHTNEMKFDLDIASGIYFIEIYSELEKTVYKFVIK